MSGTLGLPRQNLHSAPPLAPFGTGSGGGSNAPPNFIIGPVAAIVPGVLPLLGAFQGGILASWPITTPDGNGLRVQRISYKIRYTRGAAGGFPVFYATSTSSPPAGGFSAVEFRVPLVDLSSFVAAAPVGRLKFYQEELEGPAPATDAPTDYDLTFLLPPGATGSRIYAAERGVIATPGSVEIYAYGDG
jgi:hypothetical protein